MINLIVHSVSRIRTDQSKPIPVLPPSRLTCNFSSSMRQYTVRVHVFTPPPQYPVTMPHSTKKSSVTTSAWVTLVTTSSAIPTWVLPGAQMLVSVQYTPATSSTLNFPSLTFSYYCLSHNSLTAPCWPLGKYCFAWSNPGKSPFPATARYPPLSDTKLGGKLCSNKPRCFFFP